MTKFFCTLLFVAMSLSGVVQAAGQLQWYTNYQEAREVAKTASKPIAILFTGSDWCTWCHKLDQEALSTPEFANAVGDRFIFLKLDFPLNSTLPPDVTAQNKQLQRKFNVQGYPTVVIVDPKEEKLIGSAGYRQGGGKAYAQYLLKIVDDNGTYRQKMQNMDNQPLSGADLKTLYHHAQQHDLSSDAAQIMDAGSESDQKCFFLVERYRDLIAKGEYENAKIIKNQLLAEDPNNQCWINYQLAIIDFESCCKSQEQRPDIRAGSLVNYINKFGEQDRENAWQVQMIISQVYFDSNQLDEALKYARSSLKSAPSSAHPELNQAIKQLENQIAKQQK